MTDMKTFTVSVEVFLKSAVWLDDTDLPMVTALQQAALELDTNGVQAALLNTYGVTYRTLLKKASQSESFDEDEDFLNGP